MLNFHLAKNVTHKTMESVNSNKETLLFFVLFFSGQTVSSKPINMKPLITHLFFFFAFPSSADGTHEQDLS